MSIMWTGQSGERGSECIRSNRRGKRGIRERPEFFIQAIIFAAARGIRVGKGRAAVRAVGIVRVACVAARVAQHDGELALVLDGLQLDDAFQFGTHLQDAAEHAHLVVVVQRFGFACAVSVWIIDAQVSKALNE